MCHFPSRPTYGLLPRPLPPVDRLGPPNVGASFLEPNSYHDVIHAKWHLAMAEEIVALERTGTWDLVSLPLCVCPVTCKGSTRLRFALMVPLSVTKLVLWLVAFRRSMVLITIRLCSCEPYDHCSHIRHLSVSQLDVKNVFLNGELCKEVYVQPPLGYSTSRFSYACF